jgi:hypothetical protein
MSVTTECAIPASNTNGFQTLKGEHQVRYDDGMTPDQTITDGAEPNSKLTAKMSVPGQFLPRYLTERAAALPHKAAAPAARHRGSYGPVALLRTAENRERFRRQITAKWVTDQP